MRTEKSVNFIIRHRKTPLFFLLSDNADGIFVLINLRAATGAAIILRTVGQIAFAFAFLAENETATLAFQNFDKILAPAFRTAVISLHDKFSFQ